MPDSSQPGRPVRVAFVDHCALLSGAELALLRLAPALRRVTPIAVLGEDGPLVGQLTAAGVEVHVLPLAGRTAGLRRDRVRPGLPLRAVLDVVLYVGQLVRLLRALDVQIVHTNSLKACLYGSVAGRIAGTRVLWHARDRIADDYLPGPAVRLVRAAARWLPHVVVANSEATLATLAPHPRRQLRLALPDPVEQTLLERGALRRPRGEHDRGPLLVGLVGRISPWKGQDVFLRAFARAFGPGTAPGPRARARLIGTAMFGEDDYAQSLRLLVRELGIEQQVEWRGFREDVGEELAELDVLVHCSTIPEPFGQVVVEGMAAALPVVAASAGGPAEVLADGITGLLVPPGDVDGLATALRRLAGDPEGRARLAAAAHEEAKLYLDDVVAARFDDLYACLAGAS